METTNTMVLRQNAYSLLEKMPDEKLERLIRIMKEMGEEDIYKVDMAARQAAFDRLMELRRPIPDLDEKKALEEYYDEKYEEYLNLQ